MKDWIMAIAAYDYKAMDEEAIERLLVRTRETGLLALNDREWLIVAAAALDQAGIDIRRVRMPAEDALKRLVAAGLNEGLFTEEEP